mmetsp:Transcript_32704/g.77544  ORF Transcript_32704/g.77544 Transcript_32704/m.77544 type:complete len:202 (+) Transcript_32704:248-853(+)
MVTCLPFFARDAAIFSFWLSSIIGTVHFSLYPICSNVKDCWGVSSSSCVWRAVCALFAASVADGISGSIPTEAMWAPRARLSRGKHGPPNPYPGRRYFAPILESHPTAPRTSCLFASSVRSATSPSMFANAILVVIKQLMASLVISALAGDMRRTAGSFSTQSWYMRSSTSPAALLPSPINTMSGLRRPLTTSPCAMNSGL